MSNLLKYNSVVVRNDDRLVIDSNRMLDALIEQHSKAYAQTSSEPDEDGFLCGIGAETVERLVTDTDEESEELKAQASGIIEDAKTQAESILEEARGQAEELKTRAKSEGYAQGIDEAQKDSDRILSDKLSQMEQEFAARELQLRRECEDYKAHLEPKMAETMLKLFTNITGAIAQDKQDLVLNLVNSVMHNAELSREFTIRVSEDDYKFLISNKDLIYGATLPEYHIEICKDPQLERGQCVIETDAGVFDCSLDIQLQNLVQEIRILSCAVVN
ncbi:MAG: FliH/SctL family protein [Butyrivibrio sp.]|nr:FliH/SctL family protein [Butyrivibrio sp.]